MPRSVGVAVMTKPTEAQCQQAIVAAAKLGGWLVHAERPAQARSGKWATPIQGHAGWPDLVLISPDHRTVIVAELKRKPNKPTAEQLRWLDALADFARYSGCEQGLHVAVWWVPDDMDAICRALAAGRVPILRGEA